MKQQRTLPDGALSKLGVLVITDPGGYRLESELRTPFCFQANEAVTPADRQAVMAKMAAKRIGWNRR